MEEISEEEYHKFVSTLWEIERSEKCNKVVDFITIASAFILAVSFIGATISAFLTR